MKPYICIDVETRALPEAIQREVMPTEWPLGNTKDPEKVKAAIAEKEQAWLSGAALDAARSEILAVGMVGADLNAPTVTLGTERGILEHVRACATEYSDLTLVGHNLLGFDVPLLCRRMWKHGIKPPVHWLDCTPWKAKWAFDTMLAWSCGNRDQRIGLDLLAWHLGVGRKTGKGSDFAKLYETDRDKALAYLRNDLELTEAVYLKMTDPRPEPSEERVV